ncbi:(heptosyl)LPS beta-1,4-glucosyltransferase [Halospina denitrificans]|uniref:(Heptosyl)LPS beta-1,4-glucosyltransferase n=1 Tax=Halospina denitrificans TaxID=332522 RepID=A0A4R7K2Q9_9GAMM|nr:glycosyltransferase [Halospina denitrificans]TDT44347.1 (heptosyl)LPS beta-1,4-glucosyltransferase [Halospina denitrificans]
MAFSRLNPILSAVASLALIGAIGASLTVDSALSSLTFVLALAGLTVIAVARLRGRTALAPADREIKLIGFAMAFFAIASLATWALNGFSYEGFKGLGKHGRLLLFWPLFVVLARALVRESTAFIAILACAGLAGGTALAPLIENGAVARVDGATNAIPFGNLSLLSAMLLLVAAAYGYQTGRKALLGLALIGVALGLSAAYLSQTRNNLLVLPALLLFLVIAAPPRQRIVLVGLGGLILALFTGLESRIGEGLSALWSGRYDSGITYRFEIWQKALALFLEAPISGVGSQQYAQAVLNGVESGELSRGLKRCCLDHAHNDLVQILATRGLIGALSWLLLLAIPFAQFLKLIRHESPRVAHLATAGALVPVAYLMFGLTEAALERGIYVTFYLVTVTTLTYLTWKAVDESLHRHRRQKLSATIITYNEADNIGACLESLVPVADEIIVLDSGSTDDTVAIARRYTEHVTVTDWPGFGIQKQRALERATGDWVLSIDADERVTPYLAREINHTLAASPSAEAYKLPWAVTIYGKRLDFGRSGRAPLRLFQREGVRFSEAQVHEKILLPDGYRIKTLRGRLTHYTHRDYGHALEKSAQYAWLGAKQKAEKGQKTRTLLYPSLRALTTFIHVYILRLGFLDGPVGYLMAVTYAQSSFNTYAGLWTLQRKVLRDDDQ